MRKRLSAAGILLLCSAGLAQTSSAPAMVEKPDYSTPIAAFKTYARAVVAQDSKAVGESMVIEGGDKPTVDAILSATEGASRLYRAVRKSFGEDGLAQIRSPGTQELKMAAWLKMVDTAPTKNAGDSHVIIMFPAGSGGTPKAGSITLDSGATGWKVTAASAFGLDDPATAAKLKDGIPFYTKMGAAYNDVAAEVEAGKHPTVKSVQDSLMPKVTAIFQEQKPAATQK